MCGVSIPMDRLVLVTRRRTGSQKELCLIKMVNPLKVLNLLPAVTMVRLLLIRMATRIVGERVSLVTPVKLCQTYPKES